jgi:hypothetical protein
MAAEPFPLTGRCESGGYGSPAPGTARSASGEYGTDPRAEERALSAGGAGAGEAGARCRAVEATGASATLSLLGRSAALFGGLPALATTVRSRCAKVVRDDSGGLAPASAPTAGAVLGGRTDVGAIGRGFAAGVPLGAIVGLGAAGVRAARGCGAARSLPSGGGSEPFTAAYPLLYLA